MSALGYRLKLWWAIFRVSVEERLVYRGDFAFGTLMRFLPMLTQIFLWWAIFDAMAARQGDTTDVNAIRIKGYNLHDMIAYMLLVMLTRAFSSMPGLTSGIATSIQKGEIKKFLIQPVDMLGSLLLQRIAHKLVYYLIAIGPFALVFFFCRSFFDAGFPAPDQLLGLALALIGSFLLGFAMEACLGLVAFWLLEVSSLAFIFMLFSFFLSGHMFPLDLMPAPLDWIIGTMPFQYLAYFPSAVALGKVTGEDLVWGLVVQYAWVIGFWVLCRWLWVRGLARYGGYGG